MVEAACKAPLHTSTPQNASTAARLATGGADARLVGASPLIWTPRFADRFQSKDRHRFFNSLIDPNIFIRPASVSQEITNEGEIFALAGRMNNPLRNKVLSSGRPTVTSSTPAASGTSTM